MATVRFDGVGKVYPDGTRAVLDLNLSIDHGEFMILVGPSGCGKTTALRMLAGLEAITEGEISIGDRVVNALDPPKRDIAMVFQNYALYPHMSVFDNIAFPLRSRRLPKAEIRSSVERTAKLLGVGELLKRKPRALSGGQRQRVAMGRAIVRDPKAFLMDEPLSNLDAKLRVQMRSEIANVQRELGTTTLYVTHDQVEAMTMGSRIAVMRGGVLQQEGAPERVYHAPDNLFVATFIGTPAMNLLSAVLEAGPDGLTCHVAEQRLSVQGSAELERYAGSRVALGIRSEYLCDPADDRRDCPRLRGSVESVEFVGAERFVRVKLPGKPLVVDEILEVAEDIDATAVIGILREAESESSSVVARFSASSSVRPGEHVELAVATDRLHFFDLETGRAIR